MKKMQEFLYFLIYKSHQYNNNKVNIQRPKSRKNLNIKPI